MSKKKFIKANYNSPRFPFLATLVYWLVYKQLNLHGAAAGVYITLACILLSFGWINAFYELFTKDGAEPLFKEDED